MARAAPEIHGGSRASATLSYGANTVTRVTASSTNPFRMLQEPPYTIEQLQAHLQPTTTRRLLMLSGLYLVAYQLVKLAAINDVKAFLADDWTEFLNPRPSEEYKRDVVGHHEHELEACLEWHERMGVLTRDDVIAVARLREERNKVAHQLGDLLVDPSRKLDVDPLVRAGGVLRKIGVFWARISMDADPDFDGVDVPDEHIQPGFSSLYGMVLHAFFTES